MNAVFKKGVQYMALNDMEVIQYYNESDKTKKDLKRIASLCGSNVDAIITLLKKYGYKFDDNYNLKSKPKTIKFEPEIRDYKPRYKEIPKRYDTCPLIKVTELEKPLRFDPDGTWHVVEVEEW